MKAVRIYEFGDSRQLVLEDVPAPRIQADEVLVRIQDAGVNPIDWKIREGFLASTAHKHFPLTMGQDFCGEVLETGAQVREYLVGDRVFGFAPGAYAEFAAIPITSLAPVPSGVPSAVAASLPTAGLTAYQMVMDVARIDDGQRVLIIGAAGAVGVFATQLCHWRGAEVTAVASADDRDFLNSLGVAKTIDYRTERFENIVRDVDVVIDMVGGDSVTNAFRTLRRGGTLISTVGPVSQDDARAHGLRGVRFVMKQDAAELAKIGRLAAEGVLHPRLATLLPLEEAARAQDLLKEGHTQGKILLHLQ